MSDEVNASTTLTRLGEPDFIKAQPMPLLGSFIKVGLLNNTFFLFRFSFFLYCTETMRVRIWIEIDAIGSLVVEFDWYSSSQEQQASSNRG